ncbi:hypothetical protein C7N43_38140 [Sphingobacteriales bacterium UPWRP_1]|nr:hypothetical protein B6N25_06675 [Sphingobacteriales bacterium TSM_CSS]PSJ71673.1 hypothetical protein C7N43_38140 [Sphingobacteriales bacterium UPWRP_1]
MPLFNAEGKEVESIDIDQLAGHFGTNPEAYETDNTDTDFEDEIGEMDITDKEGDIKLVREYLDIYQSMLSAGCAFVVGEYDLSKYSWKGKTLDDIAARGTFLAQWLRDTIGETDSDKVLFFSMLAMSSGQTVMAALADKKRKDAAAKKQQLQNNENTANTANTSDKTG